MNKCFNCSEKGQKFHGYVICESCKKKLRLVSNATVEKYSSKFTKAAYKKDVKNRLAELDNKYIKNKIKLLDVMAKLDK